MKPLTDVLYNEAKMPNILINTSKKTPLSLAEKKAFSVVFKNVPKIRKYFAEQKQIDLSLPSTVREMGELTQNASYVISNLPMEYFINPDTKRKEKAALDAWGTALKLIERSLIISSEDSMILYNDNNQRVVNIIMEIDFNKSTKEFSIEVSPRMVQIILLLQNKLSFTTGDFNLMMQLSNERGYAWEIYWIIREKQFLQIDGTREMELKEFKKALGIENKYKNRNNNLKVNVLDTAKSSLQGTWAEFEYNIIYKRKEKKHYIVFKFKNDVQNQISNELNTMGIKLEGWIQMLKEHGFPAKTINNYKIKINSKELAPKAKELIFNDYYIEGTIRMSRIDRRERDKSPHKKPIRDINAHIITALKAGYYTEEIEKTYYQKGEEKQLKLYKEKFIVWSSLTDEERELIEAGYGGLEKYCAKQKYKIEVRDGIKGHLVNN